MNIRIFLKKAYNPVIIILAIISVAMVFADFANKINLNAKPWWLIDNIILVIFTIDYVVRFIRSDNKKKFFVTNIFDLIAILPFSTALSVLRISRLFRIARLARLTKALRIFRAFGFIGIVKKRANNFLYTNGFIYVLCSAVILIICSSFAISILEKMSFANALWWSIVTTTTVGYGDISPATAAGRVIAVILMLFGIGLIGMLTGTITTYFTNSAHKRTSQGREADQNDCSELVDIAKTLDSNKYEELLKIANVISENK